MKNWKGFIVLNDPRHQAYDLSRFVTLVNVLLCCSSSKTTVENTLKKLSLHDCHVPNNERT